MKVMDFFTTTTTVEFIARLYTSYNMRKSTSTAKLQLFNYLIRLKPFFIQEIPGIFSVHYYFNL